MKSHKDVQEDFARRGVNVSEWARQHGLPRHVVVDVLRGRAKGKRGLAHKAAVLLGIKDGSVENNHV